MPIDLPQLLADELALIARVRGRTVDELVAQALREHLPELRASAEPDITASSEPQEKVHSDRRAREVAALHARAAVVLDRPHDLVPLHRGFDRLKLG